MLPNATLVQGDLKRKTSLPYDDIEQGRQHYGGHQIRKTNHVKQLATPKGMQHVVIKQQNGKVKKKFKGGNWPKNDACNYYNFFDIIIKDLKLFGVKATQSFQKTM